MKGHLRIALLVVAVGLCTAAVSPSESPQASQATSQANEEFSQQSYVNSVIGILRAHANAIHNLNHHHIRYSDNVVRHAMALEQTFGLLGPMDWHAAEAISLMHHQNGDKMAAQANFEKLSQRSAFALKTLVLAAHYAVDEGNREALDEALENMKQSCNNCHALLPASVAPDVWGDLVRK